VPYTVAFCGEPVLETDNFSAVNLERSFQMEIGVGKGVFSCFVSYSG